MITETEDYKITTLIEEKTASIEGTLRLQSPNAYTQPFESLTDALGKVDNLTINIAKLNFLNSSGISSFATLILLAKQNDVLLTINCNKNIPWQVKTTNSFTQLYPKLTINFIEED
ncbi:hypothetical protein DID77_04255 [Candidatus Marinamargulisbacteria bacterium SCGC AG-439-L15]|nr:hypothetical protein DID77_04255 [Candidatus Marinamargulisbacteria bacterium SCGC AG-439-L15]